MINDELYVDGGVTGNIIYGGRVKEDDSLPALWAATYPSLPIPKIRYWVLFNNQLRPPPQVTAPTWPAVVTRSLEMGTRAATLTSIRHLHAQAEISRLKRGPPSKCGSWPCPTTGCRRSPASSSRKR